MEIEKIKNNIAYVCQEEKTSSIEQIEKFITEEITAITKLNLNIKEKQRILDKHITESNINKDLILKEKEAQDIEEEADNDEIIQDFINENKEKKEKQDLVEKIKNTYEKLNNATSALKQCIEQANYEENEIIKKQINIFIDKNIGPIKNKERYIKEELAVICNIYSDPDSTKDEEQRGKTYISELKLNNQAFASLVLDFENNIDTIIDFRNRQIPTDKNHGTKGCIYYDRENHEFYQILPDGNFYLHKITPLDEINNFISVAECHKVAPFQNIRLKQRLGLKTKYNKENTSVIKYKDDRRLFDYGENGPVINIDYFSGINCIDKDISQLHDNTFVNNATFNYNKDYLITKLKVGIQITTNMNRLYYHKPTKIFRDGKIIKCQMARSNKFSLKYLYLEDSGDVIAVDKNNNRQIIKKNKDYEHQEQNFKPMFYKIDKDNGLYCIDDNNNNDKTNINEKNIFIPTDNIILILNITKIKIKLLSQDEKLIIILIKQILPILKTQNTSNIFNV